MFEAAELGHTLDKDAYDREIPNLRAALLEAQYKMLEQGRFSTVILVSGVDGAGKGEMVNLLNERMDPRHIQVFAMGEPTDDERSRPPMWRFWRDLPPRGKTAVLFGSWYSQPVIDHAFKRTSRGELDHAMEDAVRFERMLTNEGVLLLKFWLHLSKKEQRRRLEDLAAHKLTRWRVSDRDWKHARRYDRFREIAERTLRETSSAQAPWIIIEAGDERYRNLTAGRFLLEALRRRLADGETAGNRAPAVPAVPRSLPPVDGVSVLDALDLSKKIPKKKYERRLEEYSGRLARAVRSKHFDRRRSLVAVFEGMDAAGKGGSIRRITRALDARFYKVIPVAAPTDEERARPYLWRFWRHAPRFGHCAIFDRSWYGRVLVERVEGFCSAADWSRAYGEINDFEEQLASHGAVVVKFWLQISQAEQLRRFRERGRIGFKRFKLGPEDWRNRKKWPDYEHAVCDMVERTSTEVAPWTLVEAEDKAYARLKILRTIVERLEVEL